MAPIPAEFPKDEYNKSLNHYYTQLDIGVLVDLYLGVLSE